MLGQQIAGTTLVNSRIDELRWAMDKAWTHSLRYLLEQGAWNFAAKRAVFQNGANGDDNIPTENVTGIIEGYSVEPAISTTPPAISSYSYSFPLPADFRHKIWIKSSVSHDFECGHQRLGGFMFTSHDPCIMEYVAEDAFTTDPANWPATFMEAMASYLAFTVAPELVVDDSGKGGRIMAPQLRDKLEGLYLRKLSDAKTKDAIQQEPRTIPLGRFARARMGQIGTTSIRRYN